LNEVLGRKARATEPSDIVAEVDLDDRVDAADQALSRERLDLEKAQTKLNLLQNYTKGKTVKELTSEVAKARSDELAKKQRCDLEREKEAKLERQIAHCKIYASAEGVVQYFKDPDRPFIQAAATVRERQLLFRILELGSSLLANVNVPESRIAHVKPGAKARVWVYAFPGETYTGVVQEVAPVPYRLSMGSDKGKNVYPTMVKLDQSQKGFSTGMTARVAIPFAERDDVIMVPLAAVLHFDFDNKTLVKVKKPDGLFESREVVTGDWDETATLIEIKQGLKPGEQVAKNPLELLNVEEQSKRGQRKGVDRRAAGKSNAP
jgi:multidrug efflux pump subunit AcrA (membrane-fusion protein)